MTGPADNLWPRIYGEGGDQGFCLLFYYGDSGASHPVIFERLPAIRALAISVYVKIAPSCEPFEPIE